tara:strand:- start:443 stop:1444 length:1002 start_codon:yes stop_codon:yes gene_type:complete
MINKQIIIHVGPAKTGTSALQYFLLRNRAELKKNGYYYPNHKTDENDIGGGHGIGKFFNIKKIINNFLESNYHTLILSAESFWKRINELNSLYSNIKFISFYRCSIYQSISGYIQVIKRDNKTEKFNTNKLNRKPNDMHLDNLKNEKINYSIIPYNFDFDDTWSIVTEFLKLIEKNNDLNHLYENKVKVVNTAYCIEAFEFKRYINKYINRFSAEKPENKFILAKIDKILQRFTDGESNFSFLNNEQFEENKKIEISFLEKLISEYNQSKLETTLEYVKKNKNKKYITQILSEEQIDKIVNYVAGEDINLLKELFGFIPTNTNNPIYNKIKKI